MRQQALAEKKEEKRKRRKSRKASSQKNAGSKPQKSSTYDSSAAAVAKDHDATHLMEKIPEEKRRGIDRHQSHKSPNSEIGAKDRQSTSPDKKHMESSAEKHQESKTVESKHISSEKSKSPERGSADDRENQNFSNERNNSALEPPSSFLRQSQNNSNVADWEITPVEILSRIMNMSRVYALKRTNERLCSSSSDFPSSAIKDGLSDVEVRNQIFNSSF